MRLHALATSGSPNSRQDAFEQLKSFPEELSLIMPTRMGNALKAMEGYGFSRFGLDSQTLWYELQAVAREQVKRDSLEARSAVDFFVSSMSHMSVLGFVSLLVIPLSGRPYVPILVALASFALVAPAYDQAVRNIGEWRWTVQALVHTSRPELAEALRLTLPATIEEERKMWLAVTGLIHRGPRDRYLKVFDSHRIQN